MAVSNVLKAMVVVGGLVFGLFFLMSLTQNDSEENNEYEKFIRTYNKSYVNESERSIRFKRFQVSVYLHETYIFYTFNTYIILRNFFRI